MKIKAKKIENSNYTVKVPFCQFDNLSISHLINLVKARWYYGC